MEGNTQDKDKLHRIAQTKPVSILLPMSQPLTANLYQATTLRTQPIRFALYVLLDRAVPRVALDLLLAQVDSILCQVLTLANLVQLDFLVITMEKEKDVHLELTQ